jgi:hypothetical protein
VELVPAVTARQVELLVAPQADVADTHMLPPANDGNLTESLNPPLERLCDTAVNPVVLQV